MQMGIETEPGNGRSGRGLGSPTFACTAIVVSDLDRAVEWYGRILGFTVVERMKIDGATVALLEGSGAQLELLQSDVPSVSTEPSLFADPPDHLLPTGNKFLVFAVEDLGHASDQLQQMGVPIIWRGKTLSPGIVSTAIRDFDGNFVHVVQHR
jgi:catechol 2,3-dioxygenase-like lactoylglutathione lyase family enzyme